MRLLAILTAGVGRDGGGHSWAGGPDDRGRDAVEAAVQIAAAHESADVVVAAVGPEAAEPVLREALARGPDRAVRVWDDPLGGADLRDPQVMAELLAAFVDDVDPDLVVGSDDCLTGTWVTLAARLGYAWATAGTDITLEREGGPVAVRRSLPGTVEQVEVELPAVLTIQAGHTEPRYAALGAVRAAQKATVPTRSLADIGLSPAALESPLERTARTEPDRDSGPTLFEGPPEWAAGELASVLRDHGERP